MTESEAKKNLETLEKFYRISKSGSALHEVLINFVTLENLVAAIQALEKQIPKKPEYEADGYADGELVYDYAKCPICGHDFEYGINDWGCEYCSDCGQKLDWRDEE